MKEKMFKRVYLETAEELKAAYEEWSHDIYGVYEGDNSPCVVVEIHEPDDLGDDYPFSPEHYPYAIEVGTAHDSFDRWGYLTFDDCKYWFYDVEIK